MSPVNKYLLQIILHGSTYSCFLHFAGNSAIDLPKDSDAYLVKRKEAFQKYEMYAEHLVLFVFNFFGLHMIFKLLFLSSFIYLLSMLMSYQFSGIGEVALPIFEASRPN